MAANKPRPDYTDQPIYWIVKLLAAKQSRNSKAEREAQAALLRLGVHIRFAARTEGQP